MSWEQDDTDLRLLIAAEEEIAGEVKGQQCQLCFSGTREYGSRRCVGCQDKQLPPRGIR